MGFWEYEPDSDDDVDDDENKSSTGEIGEENPIHEDFSRLRHIDQDLDVLDSADFISGDKEDKKDTETVVVDVDDADDIEFPSVSKSRGSLGPKATEQEHFLPTNQRLEQLQREALNAFAVIDDSEEDAIECDESPAPEAQIPRRVVPVPYELDQEEEDIEAQLETERLEMLRHATDDGANMILKVVCKHGFVNIRQSCGGTFEALYEKFRDYAVAKGWIATSTDIKLLCDDEPVDIAQNTPSDFELEDGMTIDAVLG